MYNPYITNPYDINTYLGQQQIIRVNGENGARALNLAPNSSALVLDENDPLIWFCQTDGAGYKTVTPYSIEPYVPKEQASINSLEERILRLEEKLNGKSDNRQDAKPKQQTNSNQQPKKFDAEQ